MKVGGGGGGEEEIENGSLKTPSYSIPVPLSPFSTLHASLSVYPGSPMVMGRTTTTFFVTQPRSQALHPQRGGKGVRAWDRGCL